MITSAVIPGRISADVTIYSLPDGKEVGAFQYTATSSDKPSSKAFGATQVRFTPLSARSSR